MERLRGNIFIWTKLFRLIILSSSSTEVDSIMEAANSIDFSSATDYKRLWS